MATIIGAFARCAQMRARASVWERECECERECVCERECEWERECVCERKCVCVCAFEQVRENG